MFKLAKTLTKRPHSSSIPITPNNQQQQQQEFESPPKKAKTTSTAPDASISPTSSQALLHELFLERKSRSLAPITTEGESEGAQEPTTYSTTKEIENSFEIYVNWLKKIQSFIDNLELINGKLKQFDLSKPEDFGRIAPMEILGTLIDLQELLVRYSSILSNPVNSNHLQSSPLLTLLVHKTKLLPELIPQVNFYIENGQLNYVQQHINFNLIYSLIKKQLELFNQYKIKEAISKELLIKTNPEPMPRTPKLSSKSDNFVQNFLLEEEEESASPKSDPIERQLNQIRSADQTLSHEKGKEKISSKKLVSANPVNNSASPNPAYASHSNDFSVIKPAGKLPPIACLQQTPSTFKVPRKKKPTLEIKQESSPLSSINRAEHAVSETSLYHFFHNNLPILSNTEEHSPTISNWLLINSQISTTVGNIPIEVWQLILNYVNPEDMITVIPFVSRTFNHLSKNPNIWTERFIREFPQRCQSHHNTYLKPVGRATKEDFVRNYRAEYAKFTEKSRSASYHPALPRLISLLQDNTLEMSDFEKISNRFGVSSPTLEHLFYPISQSGFSFVDLCQRQNNTAAFNYIFKRYLQETHKVDEAADVTQPNMKGFRGMNLLHIAIVSHQIDLAKFLLKQFKVTQDGNSALHLAVEAGNLSIIKELVEIHHLDINRCNAMGYTPLYLACKNGYTSIVEYLNDKGAIIPNTTPLHIAAEWGHLSVVEFLLKSFGMDVNSKDNEGCTALHLAAKHGRNSIIQLLLAEGADLKALTNKRETVFSVLHKVITRLPFNYYQNAIFFGK